MLDAKGIPEAPAYVPAHHDVGGVLSGADHQKIGILEDRPYSHWERSVHALMGVLVKKGLLSLDEHRRAIEALPSDQYEKQTYYEKVNWPDDSYVCVQPLLSLLQQGEDSFGYAAVQHATLSSRMPPLAPHRACRV